MSDTTTATVMVEDAAIKEGTTNGRVWKKVGLKDANGEYYSTFDSALGQRIIDLKGQRAKIQWKPSKDPAFKDLVAIEPVEESPIAARAEDGTADWDLIGLRKTRCLLWAHYLGSPLASGVATTDANEIYRVGSAVIALAEVDIYHRKPAEAGDDIPF